MITSKENLEAINKMNKELIEKQLKRETARGRAYQMGFEVGKQQATKELLEDELEFCNILWNEARKYTCDGWVIIRVGNRMDKLKVQLSKLGEEQE